MKQSDTRYLPLLCLMLAVLSGPAFASVIHVPADKPTIQAAINAATSGSTVIVAPGIYKENVLVYKKINLVSSNPNDWNIVKNTVIDGSKTGNEVIFIDEPDLARGSRIAGFTVRGGYEGVTYHNGFHIDDPDPASVMMVEHNIIASNHYGITNLTGTVKNNIITSNTEKGIEYIDGVIQNNLIVNNPGVGIHWAGGTVQCNTIYNNALGGVDYAWGRIINNIIWGNGTQYPLVLEDDPQYCLINGWTGGGYGNISLDPKFVNPTVGDFHLAPNSPCIDAGGFSPNHPTVDFDGNPCPRRTLTVNRGDGSYFDIGPYEASGSAVPVNQSPAQPVNQSPASSQTLSTLYVTLKASAFSDPNKEQVQLGSQWQISINGDFSKPVYDTGTLTNVFTSLAVTYGTLIPGGVYAWRVRYQDALNAWSDWSKPTAFKIIDPIKGLIQVPGTISHIQEAIDLATTMGATIVVAPGTYHEAIDFRGKDVILSSIDPFDSKVVQSTVIQGTSVQFKGTETAACHLSGFTITGGLGIWGFNTFATIENNIISHNTGYAYGAALRQCNGEIKNNIITHNQAADMPWLIIHGITVSWLPGYGSALIACNGQVHNNTIVGNSGNSTIAESTTTLSNNIFWGNSGDLFEVYREDTRLYYCCLPPGYDNSYPGKGTIFADPRFMDAAQGDFRLRSDSPCIDAGQRISGMAKSFGGNPRGYVGSSQARGDGSHFDIGAWEYVTTMTLQAPNGGEVFAAGNVLPMTWSATDNVRVELWNSRGRVADLGRQAIPGGTSTTLLRLPAIAPGSDYKLRIISVINPSVFDVSDNPFTIVADPFPMAGRVVELWEDAYNLAADDNDDVDGNANLAAKPPTGLDHPTWNKTGAVATSLDSWAARKSSYMPPPILSRSGLWWTGLSAATTTTAAGTLTHDLSIMNAESIGAAPLCRQSFVDFQMHNTACAADFPKSYNQQTGSYLYTIFNEAAAGGADFNLANYPHPASLDCSRAARFKICWNYTGGTPAFRFLIQTDNQAWFRTTKDLPMINAPALSGSWPWVVSAMTRGQKEDRMQVYDFAGLGWERISSAAESSMRDINGENRLTGKYRQPLGATQAGKPNLAKVTGMGVVLTRLAGDKSVHLMGVILEGSDFKQVRNGLHEPSWVRYP